MIDYRVMVIFSIVIAVWNIVFAATLITVYIKDKIRKNHHKRLAGRMRRKKYFKEADYYGSYQSFQQRHERQVR